jgi:glycosyltransferase involved in cell wall biosynthesis
MPNSDSLRILQVCSARSAVYGAVHSLMTLATAQRAAGHVVEFVTFTGREFGDHVQRNGFRRHEVNVRAKIDPLGILRIRKILTEGRFNVVHTHLSTSSVNGTLAGRLARIPALATVHGMSGKLSFVAANHLIAVSDQVKGHLVAQGLRSDRISVVYNGYAPATPTVEVAEARASLGIPSDAVVVGTVARITPAKGIDDAIRAIDILRRDIPKLRYLLVGEGDALPKIRQQVAEAGLEDVVIFAGYQQNVRPFLAAMDVFLFTSHKEAMGIALVEAMAEGLPIVSSDVDGIPEVVTPEVGKLCSVRDHEAMARAVAEILGNANLRAAMGKAALTRAESIFSPLAMERSTDWVYRTVLGHELRLPAADKLKQPAGL